MDGVFNSLTGALASGLGLQGTSLLAVLLFISIIARAIGKAIPDDRTGFVGFLRDFCKFVGLYTSNRIKTGISVGDVAKDVIANKPSAGRAKPSRRKSDAGFAAPPMLVVAGVLALAMILAACTAKQERFVIDVTHAVCNNTELAQTALDQAAESKDKERAQRLLNFLRVTCPLVLNQLNMERADAAGVVTPNVQ